MIIDLCVDYSPIEKLVTRLAGLSGLCASGYLSLASLARENNWIALSLCWSHLANKIDASGETVNDVGISRTRAGLFSLAYQSYNLAAERGLNVAISNKAGLLFSHASPAAALELMRAHSGEYDSADPGGPHQTRSFLERKLQEETKQEDKIVDLAEKQFQALWSLSSRDPMSTSVKADISGSLIGTQRSINIRDNVPICDAGMEAKCIKPFANTMFCVKWKDDFAIISLVPNLVQCVYFPDFNSGEGMEWLRWKRDSESPVLALSSSPS